MRRMGSANTSLQFLSIITGISSGPDAALGLISIISVFVNSRISSVKGYSTEGDEKAALSIFAFVGSLNTDKNCFWSKLAISLRLEWISLFHQITWWYCFFFLKLLCVAVKEFWVFLWYTHGLLFVVKEILVNGIMDIEVSQGLFPSRGIDSGLWAVSIAFCVLELLCKFSLLSWMDLSWWSWLNSWTVEFAHLKQNECEELCEFFLLTNTGESFPISDMKIED